MPTTEQPPIQLAVALLRSPNPDKRLDPVLVLAGGPGSPPCRWSPPPPMVFSEILTTRDMIFTDQRGTGYSRPALNCALAATSTRSLLLVGVALNDRPAVLQAGVDALLACGTEYRAQGIDLSAYNSVESAADLEELRVAEGDAQWNLDGGSYGTRLALTAMRYRPATIRSAVLDAVYPFQANFHTGVFDMFSSALAGLDTACAADPACGAAYPDLEATFARVVARLNAEAVVLPILNLQTGEPIDYLPFSGVDTTAILFQLMYITPAIPALPALISEADQGNYRRLSQLASVLFASRLPGDVPVISQGAQVAVQCNEDATFATAREFVAARDHNRLAAGLSFSPLFNEALLEVCATWGLSATSAAQNQAVRSEVPALLISGEFDPITPPSTPTRRPRRSAARPSC